MKRKIVIFSGIILSFLLLTGTGYSQESTEKFSVRLAGGYGMISVGDFNTLIDDMNDRFSDMTIDGVSFDQEGQWDKVKWGFDLEAEVIFNLTDNFGIGLGTGYLHRKKDSDTTLSYDWYYNGVHTLGVKATAVPITLSGYYFHPLSEKTTLFVKGGFGYYFGKVHYNYIADQEIFGISEDEEVKGEIKDNGAGLHAGLGLEYDVAQNIALFAEASGRYCKLGDWEGEETYAYPDGTTDKASGTAWFYKEGSESWEEYSAIALSEQEPANVSARKLEVDFSGLSFRVGVRIRF